MPVSPFVKTKYWFVWIDLRASAWKDCEDRSPYRQRHPGCRYSALTPIRIGPGASQRLLRGRVTRIDRQSPADTRLAADRICPVAIDIAAIDVRHLEVRIQLLGRRKGLRSASSTRPRLPWIMPITAICMGGRAVLASPHEAWQQPSSGCCAQSRAWAQSIKSHRRASHLGDPSYVDDRLLALAACHWAYAS